LVLAQHRVEADLARGDGESCEEIDLLLLAVVLGVIKVNHEGG
jgi:hypothetical protein